MKDFQILSVKEECNLHGKERQMQHLLLEVRKVKL